MPATVRCRDLKDNYLLLDSDSCTCWMSSQGLCSHRSGSESGRKLVSSGSDGSGSEISAEILRYSCTRNELNDSEDGASTRSTCFTNLRWSSSTNESVLGYVSCNSLDGDAHLSSHSSAHLRHQQFTPSCCNPYLQNYDVPRNSSLSQCKSTCISINTLCSGSSHNEDPSERPFSPDILSFQMAKDLVLSSDDTNACSSGSGSNSGFNLRSSDSTCSSNGSGPSLFLPSHLNDFQASNTFAACDPMQHYQVPRKAVSNVCQSVSLE